MTAAGAGATTGTPRPGFSDGLHASLDGFAYLNQHPGLWRYALWPTLLNALLSLAVLLWLVVAAIAIIAWRAGDHGDPTWWSVTREVLMREGTMIHNDNAEGSNYISTFQTRDFVRQQFAAYFEVREIVPSNENPIVQAIAVLRRRAAA